MSTTLNKLEYLDETKQQIKNALNTNFNSQIQDTDTFRSYVSKINNIYNTWSKVIGEDTTLTLSNTKKGKLGTILKGNTSQIGTPTPDAPVDVSVVSGDNTIDICGKNLCPVSSSNFTPKATWSSLTGDNANTYTDGTKITLNSGTYTITFLERTNIDSIQVNGLTSVLYGNGTFTISDKTDIYIRVKAQNNSNPVILKTQLEKGSTATEFVPYELQSYPVNLGTIELCKIGGYQDYIYKSENKWYKHSEIGKYIYDNDLTLNSQSENAFGFITPVLNVRGNLSASSFSNMSLCNMMQTLVVDSNGLNGTTSANRIRVTISKSIVSTQQQALELFSTNNLTIYYVLETPFSEEITDTTLIEQLEAIKSAMSYDTQTNITQTNDDLPFIISASALKKGGN